MKTARLIVDYYPDVIEERYRKPVTVAIAMLLADEQERAAKRVSAVTERVDEPWVEMRARIVALIRGDDA